MFREWTDAPFSEIIQRNLKIYAKPRKFQSHVMPCIMAGLDVRGQAETGSGKSAAFLLPIIQKLDERFAEEEEKSAGGWAARIRQVHALVLVPTRELAEQLYEEAKVYARGTRVRPGVGFGGFLRRENVQVLKRGSDIYIGTLGRTLDFLKEGVITLNKLKFLVLDEADRLLDTESLVELDQIMNMPGIPPKEERQNLCFSATYPDIAREQAAAICRKGQTVFQSCAPVNKRIKQEIRMVRSSRKQSVLADMFVEGKWRRFKRKAVSVCYF